jgi:Type I restriction enzyme R protein N terminus (HSDR_N)
MLSAVEGSAVAKKKDPEDVVASIQRSIEVSPKGSRRVRCHSLRALFGFQAWTVQRKDFVAALLDRRGIRAQPPISEAGLHDWIVLSLPSLPPPNDASPDPRPSEEWFDHLMSVHLDSEREVEMYFASPLFHGLGYTAEHEAAGFRFDMWEGVTRRRVEADLVYFADDRHSLADGVPLVLVEAKATDQAPDAGTGQAKSYAYWLKPAYYVTTNGDVIVVYNYQGGAVPDVKILDVKRSSLREQFDDLYRVLNPEAASGARQAKLDKLKG